MQVLEISLLVLLLGVSAYMKASENKGSKEEVETFRPESTEYTDSLIERGYTIIGYNVYQDGVLLFKGVEKNNQVDVKMYNDGYKTVGTVLPAYYFKFINDYENGNLYQ